MSTKVLITAALPYANGPLHFGHIAGAYLPADCYARFLRLIGKDVLYICGSDEHGVAITLSAETAGRKPQEHVEIYHQINQEFFKKLHISFDHYSRTTWEGHVESTQDFFKDLLKNGYIEEKVTNQLYSQEDDHFLADRYVVGKCPKCNFLEARGDECPKCGASYEATDLIEPCSKVTGAKLILKPTKHWFLRFDKFKDKLTKWLKGKNWKPNVVNFAQNYIDDLKPRAITRDSKWGIPVPLEGAEGKVLYVWFDAPIGYISATKEWALKRNKNPDAWKDYWCDEETSLVQFIGKDNIPFHAIFFPAMTMGQDQPYKLVDQLPANEFYNLEGKQFSKSSGWSIDLETFFEKYSADQIRYAIASNAPESHDSEFTWKDFQMRCNAELLGKYGNLINRVLVFAKNQCDSKVPAFGDLKAEDEKFLERIEELSKDAYGAYSDFHLRKVTQIIMELSHLGNSYFDAKKPWKGVKDESLRASMETTIACCLRCVKILALISFSVIPETAEKVWGFLGFESLLFSHKWQQVLESNFEKGHLLKDPKILFQKVEDAMIEEEISILEKITKEQKKQKEFEPLKEEITFDLTEKLDLRVGLILSAEAVPKSKNLLKLKVDVGFEKRTIISGIAKAYSDPEVLIGKKVIIVANLKPAKLMGIESQGMILAAGKSPDFTLPEIQDKAPGTVVS